MKRLSLHLLFIFGMFTIRLSAQTYPAQDYIDAWQTGDKSQTKKAAILFDDLNKHRDTILYKRLFKQLERIIKTKHNIRLHVRLNMYKMLWYLITVPKTLRFNPPSVMQIIKLAYPLNDKQLNAELYALYGEVSLRKGDMETALFYNLKALEMQEEIGAAYFPKICWMYSSVARSLYKTRDYADAIKYGLKCLKQIKPYEKTHPRDQIFVYDIIGNAYYKTGDLTEAAVYFQKITRLIKARNLDSSKWGRFWLALVNGYWGRISFEQQQYDEASLLFSQAISASIAFNEMSNAARFSNDLAESEIMQKKYTSAILNFRKARQWSKMSNDDQASLDAAMGLGKLYREKGNTDSAYYYYDLYHQLSNKIQALLNRSKLNIARARLDHESMQDSLQQSGKRIKQDRLLLGAILIAVFLLALIAALFYNRYRLRQQLRQQSMEKKALEALQQAKTFSEHMKEKDKLIYSLSKALKCPAGDKGKKTEGVLLEYSLITDREWIRFKNTFTNTYPGFFIKLALQIPNISPAEERLASLIFLKLNTAQMANMLGISQQSVSRSKRRLKTRMEISETLTLEQIIENLI